MPRKARGQRAAAAMSRSVCTEGLMEKEITARDAVNLYSSRSVNQPASLSRVNALFRRILREVQRTACRDAVC